MGTQKGKVGLGVVMGWCYAGVTLLVRYIRVPIVLAFVSKAEYGIWTLLFGIVGMAMTLEVVMSQIVTREVAKARLAAGTESPAIPWVKLRTIDRLYRRVILGLALAFLALSAVLPHLVKREMPLGSLLVLWLGCGSGALLFLYTARHLAILDGLEEVWAGKLAKAAYELVGFLMLLALLFLAHLGIYALAAAFLLQTVFYAGLNKYLLARYTPPPPSASVRHAPIDRDLWRVLSSSCQSLTGVQIGITLIYLTPVLLIPKLVSLSVLADYGIMLQLFQLTNFFALPLLFVWYPSLPSRIQARGDLSRGLRYLFVAAVAANIFLLLGSELILRLWVGPGHFLGSDVLRILAIVAVLGVTQIGLQSILVAMDRVRAVNRWVWVAVAVNILVALGLSRPWGIVGILLGPLVAEVLLVAAFDWMVRPVASSGQSLVLSVLGRTWAECVVFAMACLAITWQASLFLAPTWATRSGLLLAGAVCAYVSLDYYDRSLLFQELRHLGRAVPIMRQEL